MNMSNEEFKRWKPKYHFVINDNGCPGDANGAFWHNGRYHLMYLVCRGDNKYSWGHVSSTDMFHWDEHPATTLKKSKVMTSPVECTPAQDTRTSLCLPRTERQPSVNLWGERLRRNAGHFKI